MVSVMATGYVSVLDYNSGNKNQAIINFVPTVASYTTDILIKRADVVSDAISNAIGIGIGFYTQYWLDRDNHNSKSRGSEECRR
jgi:hypothetical protein